MNYSGDNNNGRQIDMDGVGTGTGFQPDMVWVAIRSGTAGSQTITDSVRGADSIVSPNSSSGVSSYDSTWRSSYGQITEFNSTGFKVNKGSSSSNFNSNNNTYIAWGWKAGGSPTEDNTVAASTGNAMTSTDANNSSVSLDGVLQTNYTPSGSPTIYPKRMSINTEAGFSVVKYSGNSTANATIPHGLNSKVEFSIIKGLNTAQAWSIYHKDSSGGLLFSSAVAGSGYDHSASGDNLVSFSSGWDGVNGAYNYIMYCWHSVEGFSAFGSYTGNLSTNGPFVYTGFRPAFVLLKHSTGANQHWWIYDLSLIHI